MNLSLESVIRVQDSVTSKCSPIFKDNILITVTTDCLILVQNTNDSYCKGFVLKSHQKEITALCLSQSKDYICSCSEERVNMWDISTISGEGNLYFDEYNIPRPIVVEEGLGYVYNCAVNNNFIALCLEKEILTFKLQFSIGGGIEKIVNYTKINAGQFCGNMCCFPRSQEAVLISAGNGGYLYMWNINTGELIYKTACSSAYSITFCKFSETILLTGTNKGKLHVHEVREINLQKVLTIDVTKSFVGTRILNFKKSRCSYPYNQSADNSNIIENDCIIFCAEVCPREVRSLKSEKGDVIDTLVDTSVLDDILSTGRILIVCCNFGIVLYDSKSGCSLSMMRVPELLPEISADGDTSLIAELMVLGGCRPRNIRCAMKPFLNNLFVINLLLIVGEEPDTLVRVISTLPLYEKSPLKKSSKPFLVSEILTYARTTQNSSAYVKSTVSSGYGKTYNRKMFQPILNVCRNKSSSRELHKMKKYLYENFTNQLLTFGNDTKVVQDKMIMCNIQGKTIRLTTSPCGQYLACSSSSSEICVLNFLKLDSENITLVGHDGAINSVHFSLNGCWLISASNDSSVKIWDWKRRQVVVHINTSDSGKQTFAASSLKSNFQSVIGARFYYVDKFIATASGNSLKLFSYSLHDGIHDSSSYKLVSSATMKTQRITCFTAANEFHSYIAICACSDKSIKVYDFNYESVCLEIKDVHSSVPHVVRQVEGSRCVSHPAAIYDLIFSAAVRDVVKLWDLRTSRCVQTFSHHINRSYSSGINISPCCRYLAASSDDNLVYIYDTRKVSTCLEKLSELDDVIMDVTFNPCNPLLAAVGLNNNVITYSTK